MTLGIHDYLLSQIGNIKSSIGMWVSFIARVAYSAECSSIPDVPQKCDSFHKFKTHLFLQTFKDIKVEDILIWIEEISK